MSTLAQHRRWPASTRVGSAPAPTASVVSTATSDFYDVLTDLAGIPSRSQARRFAVAAMGGMLGRLTRQSAVVVATALPAPLPRLIDSDLNAGPRFAPFGEVVEEVAAETRESPEAVRRYLRALGIALERSLTAEGIERLRAEIPQVAREILPSYRPVSSERPSVLKSSEVEPLCTAPIDPDDRTAYVRRRAV